MFVLMRLILNDLGIYKIRNDRFPDKSIKTRDGLLPSQPSSQAMNT